METSPRDCEKIAEVVDYQVDRCGRLLDGPDPVASLDRLYDDVLRHVGGHLQDDSAALFIARQGL